MHAMTGVKMEMLIYKQDCAHKQGKMKVDYHTKHKQFSLLLTISPFYTMVCLIGEVKQ